MDKNQRLIRTEIVQYCLDQGTGIIYDTEPQVEEKAETTEKERQNAVKHHKSVRYVDKTVIDFFENHDHPEQVYEAVKSNMDLCTFDEWQALQTVLFAHTGLDNTISSKTAIAINGALWEENITPMELVPSNSYILATVNMIAGIHAIEYNSRTEPLNVVGIYETTESDGSPAKKHVVKLGSPSAAIHKLTDVDLMTVMCDGHTIDAYIIDDRVMSMEPFFKCSVKQDKMTSEYQLELRFCKMTLENYEKYSGLDKD